MPDHEHDAFCDFMLDRLADFANSDDADMLADDMEEMLELEAELNG